MLLTNTSPKKPKSRTSASLSRVKLVTRIASTAVTTNIVYAYMFASSVAVVTFIAVYPLATTSAAAMPTVSWGRIVAIAVSGFISI